MIYKNIDADLIHQLSFYPKKRLQLFSSLSLGKQAILLPKLSKRIRTTIINALPDRELITILEHLDPDEATDILQLLPLRRQKKVISQLKEDLKKSVELLTEFDPQTAAGIMNIDYIQVQETDTVLQVSNKVKKHEHRTGRLPAIIVLREGRVIGYVPGHKLGLSQPQEEIKKLIRPISTVKHNARHEEVIKIFKEHPHNKVTVIGEHGNILGIIYSDDVLRLLEEQETASLYNFAGVHEEESVIDNTKTKVNLRYKWLIINLFTAFLASFTVGLFEETISKYVLLAVYMPIVAGMGGNAATQTLAVLVRGIALKQIELKNSWKTLKREVIAGFINGLINGLIVALIVITVNKDFKVAIILASAMVINLIMAGFFGTLIPLVMKKLGKDPATSATIFITTATDVLGFLAFLGLATVLLG